MWEYWNKGIPCHQFRKESKADIDLVLSINETMNQKQKSKSNQQNMLNDLLTNSKW